MRRPQDIPAVYATAAPAPNYWRRLLQSRYVAVVLSAVIGTLCALAACFFVLSWEYRIADNDFQGQAKSFLETVNTDLGDANTLLYTIGAFFAARDLGHPVSANEFAQFSTVLHHRVVGLRDIAWSPRVTLAERQAFEREQAREAELPGYRIRQHGPHGRLVVAPSRPVYYPIQYVEAVAMKRAVLGIDLIAESRRAHAVLRALATGQPAATPPLDIVGTARPLGGVLGYMVVQDAGRAAGRRMNSAQGVVVGVFDIASMVEDIIVKAHADHLNLDLFYPAASGRLIYRSSSAQGTRESTQGALLAGVHFQGTVLMIDQRWGAIVTPRTGLSVFRWSGNAAIILLAGLMMTATIVAYLLMSERRTLQLEALATNLRATTIDLHRRSEQISYLWRHDTLTGLPNRTLFSERINDAVEHSRRGIPFALVSLDLDRFKAVNDTLGHKGGDLLLCAVAERIKSCVRIVDTAARLGGDEFAIVLVNTASVESITLITDRLIAAISQAYPIEGRSMVVGVSIGVALSTADATAESLLERADLALYEAKAEGRGTCCFFDEKLLKRVKRDSAIL